MDEQTLRVFLTLCETENMRDAAATLRVNQSNVSRAIARLEAELDTELFTRHGRRLSLNRAGAAFRADASDIVERYEIGRRHLSQVTGPATAIRLGFLQSTARWAVPRLVRSFRDVLPAARFELRQGFSRELLGWIEEDALDAAFSTPPTRVDLTWLPMIEQRLSVAIPPGHRFSARESLTPKDLHGEDFVAFSRTTEIRTIIDPMLQAAGAQVRIAFESSEVDTIRGLVEAGLGVAILPEPIQDEAGPIHVPLVPAQVRRLGLAWNGARANPASVRAFLAHCRGLDLRG